MTLQEWKPSLFPFEAASDMPGMTFGLGCAVPAASVCLYQSCGRLCRTRSVCTVIEVLSSSVIEVLSWCYSSVILMFLKHYLSQLLRCYFYQLSKCLDSYWSVTFTSYWAVILTVIEVVSMKLLKCYLHTVWFFARSASLRGSRETD